MFGRPTVKSGAPRLVSFLDRKPTDRLTKLLWGAKQGSIEAAKPLSYYYDPCTIIDFKDNSNRHIIFKAQNIVDLYIYN